MTTSLRNRVTSSCRPSVPAAAGRSSTSAGSELFGCSEQELTGTLLALLGGLSANVMSSDVWALSVLHARTLVGQYGVEQAAFDRIIVRVLEAQQRNRASNPMASMF